MHPLKQAMQVRKDMVAVACEALHRLFSNNQDQLVKQALDVEFVQFLLTLLEGRLDIIDNPAMTKAQIVKALKSMSRSLLYGERVVSILEKSPIWAEYKDQKHDLFISSAPVAGYLTGIVYLPPMFFLLIPIHYSSRNTNCSRLFNARFKCQSSIAATTS